MTSTSRNRIYPVFLPHEGCPFQCVYCNQHAVTDSSLKKSSDKGLLSRFDACFGRLVEHAERSGIPGELAFYGGTFTALPEETLKGLLQRVSLWVEKGVFTGIRFSTRPDGISREVCALLREYPVRTVELGVQSLSDQVLQESRRGYSAKTVENAAALVRANGWKLGFQLMLGLPGDTRERFLDSVSRSALLRPDMVRLYPTLVLDKTLLAKWYRAGSYQPLDLDDAVEWAADAYDIFGEAQIPIARMGLHADPELEKPGNILGGPYHPAFGYLVKVQWWRKRVDRYLEKEVQAHGGVSLILHVSSPCSSEMIGPRRSNLLHWQRRWNLEHVEVQGNDAIPAGSFHSEWGRKASVGGRRRRKRRTRDFI